MTYIPQHLSRWKLPQHYFGANWNGYFIAPVSRNRDSDALAESNFAEQWRALKPHSADVPDADESSPTIVRESHFLCGWVEWVAIHQSNEAALREADKIAERLENYPVLNEEDWSNREEEEAQAVWSKCYRDCDRVQYIRRNRSQFDFNSFSEMLAVARGRYFNGYASELLH